METKVESYQDINKLLKSLRRAYAAAEEFDRPTISIAIKYYDKKLREMDASVGGIYGPGGNYNARRMEFFIPWLCTLLAFLSGIFSGMCILPFCK